MKKSEFHQWSCDVLLGQLEQDVARRRSLDGKAAQVIGAVAAVLLWSITSLEKAPPTCFQLIIATMAYATMLVGAVLAAFHAFSAIRISDGAYPDERSLTSDEEKPLSARLLRIRDHLIGVVVEAQKRTNLKAQAVKGAERWALAAIPAGVLAAFMARMAVVLALGG